MNKSVIILLITISFSLSPILHAQQVTADFLLIERPQALTIFNAFQQSMTVAQKTALGAFTPLQIINTDSYLGDDITPVLKGKINGKFYYLLQDKDRRIINRLNAGLLKRYTRCAVLGDTVRITQSGIRLFAPRTPGLRTIRQLTQGQAVQRIFKKRNYIYVRLLADTTTYGWLPASAARYWEKTVTPPMVKSPLPDANLKQRILNHFMAANRKYRILFSYFESKGHAARPLPRWQEAKEENKLLFRLQPAESADDLKRSTQILLHDVQGELIGSGWRARYEHGQIIIDK